MLRVGSIVIRVDDLERQRAFWTAALDYLARDSDADDFALLHPKDGIGPNVSLDRVRSTVQVPPRIHLDLYAEDQAAEVERLIALGATAPAIVIVLCVTGFPSTACAMLTRVSTLLTMAPT